MLKLVRFGLELAYDLLREALRPKPPAGPLPWRALEHQRAQANAAARSAPNALSGASAKPPLRAVPRPR